MTRKPKETPHLRVRIEPTLLGRLEKAREKSGQTLTGEIVDKLKASFQREDEKEIIKTAAEAAAKSSSGAMIEWLKTNMRDLSQPPPKPPKEEDAK